MPGGSGARCGAVRCDAVHGMACMLYGVLPPIERDIADGRWGWQMGVGRWQMSDGRWQSGRKYGSTYMRDDGRYSRYLR